MGLAMLAGYVDALGFLQLNGLFVSFMSGNSTRLAVGAALANPAGLLAGALIAAFVVGVIAGSAAGHLARDAREPVVLAATFVLLVISASGHAIGTTYPIPTLFMAAAMGAANNVFQRAGEVSVGVTYMTGTLVKLGQHVAAALFGGPRFGWMPYLLLWLSLVAGAIGGAITFPLLGLTAIWLATAFALMLMVAAIVINRASCARR
nr:YoaK family protein [Sphingomonas vulcanisoli]